MGLIFSLGYTGLRRSATGHLVVSAPMAAA